MISSVSYEHPSVNRPLYNFAEADRIARVTSNTSRRWLKGYSFWYDGEQRNMPPVTWTTETKDAVSFVDLMEVATIGKLRKKGFSFKRIRKINATARFYLQTNRPLVTERFKVKGREIFVDDGFGILLDVGYGAGMQAWDEVLDPFLDTVEYEEKLFAAGGRSVKMSRYSSIPTMGSACRWSRVRAFGRRSSRSATGLATAQTR